MKGGLKDERGEGVEYIEQHPNAKQLRVNNDDNSIH